MPDWAHSYLQAFTSFHLCPRAMPGANYMGGKRNAAKARSKDSVGRMQKGFFSKRRLDMLSQGLARTRGGHNTLTNQGTGETGPSCIELAHARQRIDSQQGILGYIPSPAQFSPRTPNSRKTNKQLNHNSSHSNDTRSSKVIEALDTSEPLFFRAALDRVLALPDLAGLTGRYSRPGELQTHKRRGSFEGLERKDNYSPGTRPYKKRKPLSRQVENEKFANGSSMPRDKRISRLEEEPALVSSPPDNSSPVSQPTINQTNLGAIQEEIWSSDMDYDDIEYSDSRAPSSLKKGLRTAPSSGHSPVLSLGGYSSSMASVDARLSSLRTPDAYCSGGYTQPCFNVDGSPTSNTGNTTRTVIRKFSSNNLFDHKDPWHTIGVILGLSPASQITNMTYNSPDTNIALVKRGVELQDPMLTGLGEVLLPHGTSLPPSSPPANYYSTPSPTHYADRWTSSLEPNESPSPANHDTDLLLSFGSNSPLIRSPSISAPILGTSSGLTGHCVSLATPATTDGRRSLINLSIYWPTSPVPAMAHTPIGESPEAQGIKWNSKHQLHRPGSASNESSVLPPRSSALPAPTSDKGDTPIHPPAALNVQPSDSSPPVSDVFRKASPASPVYYPDGSGNQLRPSFVTLEQTPTTGIPTEVLVTSSKFGTSKYINEPVSLQLTEVNGVYQGPCLFPEDLDSSSDSDES